MSRISWIQNGSSYRRVEGEISNVDEIPIAVYNVNIDRSGWYLEYYAQKFTFDYKVYGLEKRFIDHVIKAYENTTGNFGVLMNGTKGTGKSVTAKLLANAFNIPIIIIKSFGDNNQGLIEYLASFNFDCVLFFDEFEKNFNEKDSSILQIMDGVYTSDYRKIFLLTTNTTVINDNLLSRPSRLRYIREFGNLDKSIVLEFLKDTLQDKSATERVLEYVDSLEISTIDILKTIVEDINIFGIEEFLETKHYFNVKTTYYKYLTNFAYSSIDWIEDNNYTIEKFVEDCKRRKLVKPNRNEFKSEEEFLKAYKQYEKDSRTIIDYINTYNTLDVDVAWNKVKLGEQWGYDDDHVVIKVDLKNHVIVTQEDGDIRFYQIINPDQKPTLYGDPKNNLSFVF